MADIVPTSSGKPVLTMSAVLAALQFIIGGSALADILPGQVYGVLALILGGVQVGWGVYTTGQVTPWQDVVAKVGHGRVIAGPAAAQITGTSVEVVPAGAGRHRADGPADAAGEGTSDEAGAAQLLLALGIPLTVIGAVLYVFTTYDTSALLVLFIGVVLVVVHIATDHRGPRPPNRPA